MADQVIQVSLSLTGEAPTRGQATLHPRAAATRIARAAVMLLGLWAVAGACFFIPIAHFVLVPGFGAAGLVMAIVRLMDDVSLMSAEGVCPRCKVPRVFQSAGRFRPGRAVHCDGCGCQIAVHPA